MNENVKTNEGLNEKQRECLNAVVGWGTIALAGLVGYKVGKTITNLNWSLGLLGCFTVDPGLEERILEDCQKIKNKIK